MEGKGFKIFLRQKGENDKPLQVPDRNEFLKEIGCSYDGSGWRSNTEFYWRVIPDNGVAHSDIVSLPSKYPFVAKVEPDK